MIVVADASVAIKWFLPEEGSDDAARLLASDAEFHAPDSLRLDLAGLLQRREMRGEIAAGHARGIARELDRMVAGWHPSAELLGAAYAEAMARRHPVADLVYFELSKRLRAPLITANRALLICMPWASVTALEDWAKMADA